MDFDNQLAALADRVAGLVDNVETEEAAKTAMVLPFLQLLGYDVFNPSEVVPEFTADVGIKRGEKVDYALIRNGEPAVLIECKHPSTRLDVHASQLFRYFATTTARIAILSNGVQYLFFADLEAPNRMDERPFLKVDLLDFDRSSAKELQRLRKADFDVQNILESAEQLRTRSALRGRISEILDTVPDEFVRLAIDPIYDGQLRKNVIDRYRPLLTSAINAHITELVDARLRKALDTSRSDSDSTDEPKTEEPPAEAHVEADADDGIETTFEELAGLYTVKAMLRDRVDTARLVERDRKHYFSVNLDDNQRKPVCRLWFNGKTKYVGVFDGEKKETRHQIKSIEDIYRLADELGQSLDWALKL